jgi:phosphoribosylaminoimidazole (AIR) synthetase
VFNLGLGMIVTLPAHDASRAIEVLRDAGHAAHLVGEVVDGAGRVRLG